MMKMVARSKCAIKKAINNIQKTEYWSLINKSEQKRYEFLFNLIHDLLRDVDLKNLPYKLIEEEELKLIFYRDFICDGSKSDEEIKYDYWKQNYPTTYGTQKEQIDGLYENSPK